MADQKLSELTAATSAEGADNLYLVKGGASQKITVASLFADVDTPVKLGSTVAVDDSETLTVLVLYLSLKQLQYSAIQEHLEH